ncbi:Holliday junction branch migration protein RuvA [Crenalkalicoccus roseus]|uniref:Holliday junction branch migration protein RuvA n=1 Tax=Crenalkalicoccus roseus TaxID=1485588 RepID=UPI00108190E9|nr:Holliday junction branch migration protein RuvA [Crenalkalicoccus roseus]
MIGKLTGRLDGVVEGGCILDVGGVGYLVSCSSRTVSALPAPPARGTLLIETHVREDAITLYGFAEETERACFRALTRIQGVGPTLALAILSALSPEDLAEAVRVGDKASLGRAKGVGPKLVGRLLTELRDWAGALAPGRGPGPAAAAPPAAAGVEADAVSALLNLGWKRPEAASAVARVLGRLGHDAPLGAVIRDSLRELSPR